MDVYVLIGVIAIMLIFAGHVLYIRVKILTTRSVEELCRLYFRTRIKKIDFDPLKEITHCRFKELVYIELGELGSSSDLGAYLESFEKFALSKLLRDNKELVARFLDRSFVTGIITRISDKLEDTEWRPNEILINRINAFFVETQHQLNSQRMRDKFKKRFS